MASPETSLLLVDDVPENLLALEAALEPLGHRTVRASSGEEALKCLLKEDDFAAVVLDVQMPGLDGFETALAIRQRERTSNVPIIFLTAISRDDDHRLKGYAAGAVDYIFKPVDPELLRAKVSVFVRLYTAERDLRRQKEELKEQALELARSNADLDQFASVVSHDLREPLNVIGGYLELLNDRVSTHLDDRSREWLSRVNRCAERMSELVDELLSYSRVLADEGWPQVGPVALADTVTNAVENLQASIAASSSRVEVGAPLPSVRATSLQLTQVLGNLIGNSIRHGGGAPVTVSVSAQASGDLVTVRVADDGPGLPPEQMERVFGMFERHGDGPQPSTGLGLAICRRIVGRMGGRIWMEPNSGPGVSVYFTMPASGHP